MESGRVGLKINQPRRVRRAESFVMGIEVRTAHTHTSQHTSQPRAAKIPHWQRFAAERLLPYIAEPVQPDVIYSVYTDYGSDYSRDYAVIVAVEVSSIDNPPENMVGLSLPAGDYLVFAARGRSSRAMIQTWQQIWDYFTATCPYQRAFTNDFELYQQQQVDIYIAIQAV